MKVGETTRRVEGDRDRVIPGHWRIKWMKDNDERSEKAKKEMKRLLVLCCLVHDIVLTPMQYAGAIDACYANAKPGEVEEAIASLEAHWQQALLEDPSA